MEDNKPTRGAPKGNKNRQEGEEPMTSYIYIRCTPQDKARWVKAAEGSKLSKWVTDVLNKNS